MQQFLTIMPDGVLSRAERRPRETVTVCKSEVIKCTECGFSTENNNNNGKSLHTLLDTGSGSTIMNECLAQELTLPVLPVNPLRKGNNRRLLTSSGTPLYVVGSYDLNINFSGLIVPYNTLIVHSLQENLTMELDFLSQNNVIIDYRLKIVSIADDLVRLLLHVSNDGQSYVHTVKAVYLKLCDSCSCMEQSSNQCHYSNFPGFLQKTTKNISFHKVVPVT